MGSAKSISSAKMSSSSKVKNKMKRQSLHIKRKKALDVAKRDERFRRRKEEDKDPRLREERLKRNIPLTLERKRVWDEVDRDTGDLVGVSVDVERLKRQKLDEERHSLEEDESDDDDDGNKVDDDVVDEDADSMIDSTSDIETAPSEPPPPRNPSKGPKSATERATSPTQSTSSTNLDLTPSALAAKFPTLFSTSHPPRTPKLLITTSLNSTLHHQAHLLTTLFPHSVYIPRSAHYNGHKFSVREICSFASNRSYTAVLILTEDLKRPSGLTIVHLPSGPTFHFSLSSWLDGKLLPGHGNPTNHLPELILNNFRTPLGLLAAHLFRSLFPPQPELPGRQVVTLHNQRDYIFLRRHRYVFREKRATEKSVTGPDGKDVKGVEGIRAGLQELGPRFTLKLRRVDVGIQRASGQEWVWRGGMEKERRRFQL